MKKEQKLHELSKELVYQMTGNYAEDVQDADFQIAWTFLKKAMDYTPCCDKLKDIEILTFDAWVNKYYRSVLNGYSDKKTEEFKTEKEILKIYEGVEQNL